MKQAHKNRYYLLQASLIILSAVLLSPHNLINFKMCAGSVLSENLALSRPETKNTPDVSGNLMRTNPIITFVILLTSISCFGQKIDSVKALLNKKSFHALDSYLKRIDSTNRRISYYQEVNRQIINSYTEIVIEFEESFPCKEENVYNVYPYKIKLLTSGDKIIYCRMENHSISIFTTIEASYTLRDSIKQLQRFYQTIYKRNISISDFFSDKIVYGYACGFVGTNPKFRVKLDKLVSLKNTKELHKWLTSPITELQVYAIDGFSQLKKAGLCLTPDELELIKLVKSKEGNLRTCWGCIYGTNTIKEMTKGSLF